MNMKRTVMKAPAASAIMYDHHGRVVLPLMFAMRPEAQFSSAYAKTKGMPGLTSEECQYHEDEVPPMGCLLVLLHCLPVGVGLRLCTSLLEGGDDIGTPKECAVADQSANLPVRW